MVPRRRAPLRSTVLATGVVVVDSRAGLPRMGRTRHDEPVAALARGLDRLAAVLGDPRGMAPSGHDGGVHRADRLHGDVVGARSGACRATAHAPGCALVLACLPGRPARCRVGALTPGLGWLCMVPVRPRLDRRRAARTGRGPPRGGSAQPHRRAARRGDRPVRRARCGVATHDRRGTHPGQRRDGVGGVPHRHDARGPAGPHRRRADRRADEQQAQVDARAAGQGHAAGARPVRTGRARPARCRPDGARAAHAHRLAGDVDPGLRPRSGDGGDASARGGMARRPVHDAGAGPEQGRGSRARGQPRLRGAA